MKRLMKLGTVLTVLSLVVSAFNGIGKGEKVNKSNSKGARTK